MGVSKTHQILTDQTEAGNGDWHHISNVESWTIQVDLTGNTGTVDFYIDVSYNASDPVQIAEFTGVSGNVSRASGMHNEPYNWVRVRVGTISAAATVNANITQQNSSC